MSVGQNGQALGAPLSILNILCLHRRSGDATRVRDEKRSRSSSSQARTSSVAAFVLDGAARGEWAATCCLKMLLTAHTHTSPNLEEHKVGPSVHCQSGHPRDRRDLRSDLAYTVHPHACKPRWTGPFYGTASLSLTGLGEELGRHTTTAVTDGL